MRVSRYRGKLYIQTVVPSYFVQQHRLTNVNAEKWRFHPQYKQGDCVPRVSIQVEEEETANGIIMFGPPQVVHLTTTCDPNVEASWSIQYFKIKPKFQLSQNNQYDARLDVEVESIVKLKKRVIKKDDMIYKSDSDADDMSTT